METTSRPDLSSSVPHSPAVFNVSPNLYNEFMPYELDPMSDNYYTFSTSGDYDQNIDYIPKGSIKGDDWESEVMEGETSKEVEAVQKRKNRREQNRNAQRNFRQRQRAAFRQANASLEEEKITSATLQKQVVSLKDEIANLEKEKQWLLNMTIELCEANHKLKEIIAESGSGVWYENSSFKV